MLDVTKFESVSHLQAFSVSTSTFFCSLTTLFLPLTKHGNCGFCGTTGLGKDLTKDQLAVISSLVKGGKKSKKISAITGPPL